MEIDITPDWDAMFEFAIRIVETEIDKTNGQQLVVEMLKYGQRMHSQ